MVWTCLTPREANTMPPPPNPYPLELQTRLHSIFEKAVSCVFHTSLWGCCRRLHILWTQTSCYPYLKHLNYSKWAIWVTNVTPSHPTPPWQTTNPWCWASLCAIHHFDPELSQWHWITDACHLFHKSHNLLFFNWCEHSFLSPLPSNGGTKEMVLQCTDGNTKFLWCHQHSWTYIYHSQSTFELLIIPIAIFWILFFTNISH